MGQGSKTRWWFETRKVSGLRELLQDLGDPDHVEAGWSCATHAGRKFSRGTQTPCSESAPSSHVPCDQLHLASVDTVSSPSPPACCSGRSDVLQSCECMHEHAGAALR